jgi:hypothetical protein
VVANGIRVSIRLTPRAGADRIVGVASGALKIAVTALPAENRANDALLRLLAREWRLTPRDLSIAAGAKSRDKTVLIRGEPRALLARLTLLLGDAINDQSNISVAPGRTVPILTR